MNNHATPDFYTIGYSGRTIEQFIATLREAGVKTLVDVRYLPLSRHKPDFSKTRLRWHLEWDRIAYQHMRIFGFSRTARAMASESGNPDELWQWYDKEVAQPQFIKLLAAKIDEAWRPYALMCTEADPLTCHRHRLALALERLGFRGVDL